MTEYRIVAKIDPSGVTQGAAKVKQDLRGVEAAAAGTNKVLNESSKAAGRAGDANTRMADTARRAQAALDAEAREVEELNNLLARNKALLDSGSISQQQFARVQQLVENASRRNTQSLGQQRAGYQQLGFQIQDITQTMALGINPLVVLAQQGGQTASALQLALGETGTAGRVAGFLAGPWGSLILAGVTVVGLLGLEFLKTGSAIEEATKKLQDDARESEAARQAKEEYRKTQEGLSQAILENVEALRKSQKSQQQAEQDAYRAAKADLAQTVSIRQKTVAILEQTKALAEQQRVNSQRVGERGDAAAIGLLSTEPELARVTAQLEKANADLKTAEEQVRRTQIPIIQRQVAESFDGTAAATGRYERATQKLIDQRAAGKISEAQLRAGLAAETKARDAAIEAVRKQEAAERKLNTTRADGVSRFKSREQAIGVAGRELQRAGLKVGENNQFGGVTGGHKNNTAHGKYAIDVDIAGASDKSPTPPDIKSKYDALAKRYAARGYKVLWAGSVYHPDGKVTPITGDDKHYGHMHLEAPGTIIGKATQASTESQANREVNREEQAADFISNIENAAAQRGQGNNRADTLKASIDRAVADFEVRFERAATTGEKAKISDALTQADAREIAVRFDEAFIQPLQRLQALQGKVGLEREILNAQLDEAKTRGIDVKALSDADKAAIENSIRKGDALRRETEILQSLRGPVETYKAQIEALNALLGRGAISQQEFNREVQNLDLQRQNAGQQQRLGGGGEAGAKMEQMRVEYEAERALAQQLFDAKIITAKEQKDRELQLEIDFQRAKRDIALNSTGELFGALADMAEAGFGRQSAVYKAAFVAQKAVAIAQSIIAIQTGIAQALSLPFPANLVAAATVAAQAASIVSNIKAVSLNLADGGIVRGPGGPREDKVPANLSNGEFVVNAAATSKNRALLEAINNGGNVRQARQTAANTTAAAMPGGETYQLTFGDVVVQTSARPEDGRAIGRDVKEQLKGLVREEIKNAKRTGGELTKTRNSVMA